ncbi:head morphogenesis [Vibrio phage pYD21-A]|uniref:head morphogenesis n=1 Tax=Vibrio phage pYD21-A TaxID=754049 RepID=UPI0002C11C2E|nr:head morphogenesis [Vibrio phage pYD21-A]AGH16047.1 hypothetical protein VPKG_00010 [Vibrio phage pYD21-A]
MLTNMAEKSSWFARNADFDVPVDLLREEFNIMANGVRYEYQVDAGLMQRTMDTIASILQQDLLDGSDFWTTRFWMNVYLEDAVQDGTLESFESALLITQGTPVESSIAILDAQQQLASPAYYDRLRLVHGRVFEEMQGLTAEMKSQLRVTLTEGMARGVGVRDLTSMINKRLSVGLVRAERIARTEISRAYNVAYSDEAKDLNKTALKDDDWEIRAMHRSALAPTSRDDHVFRHAHVGTFEEQDQWWSVGSRRVNCLCSVLDVLYNKKTGEILQKSLQARMIKQKEQYQSVN